MLKSWVARRAAGLFLLAITAMVCTVQARTVSPLPQSLGFMSNYRAYVGQAMYVTVTGSTSGSIWGSGPYTDDSDVATAAVQAGLVASGKQAVVKVLVMPGQSSYKGGTANGVASSDYGSYMGSYAVAADDGGDNPALPDPSDLGDFETAAPGSAYLFKVVGDTAHTIWGNNTYTSDSALATAAVHAGVLAAGQSGTVRVVIVPGLDNYPGSTRNGVTSSSYGSWDGSYAVSDTNGATPLAPYPGMQGNPLPDPGDMGEYDSAIGGAFYFSVTGKTNGSVWGTGSYTSDSNLATAAVHAGVLAKGQTGVVKVNITAGQASYAGSTSHGVTSNSYGTWGASYAPAQPDGLLGSIPVPSSPLTASGSAKSAFSYAMAASPVATTYNATGLPEGLSVNKATGLISGTPKLSGVFRIDLLTGSSIGTSSATLLLGVDVNVSAPSAADLDSFFNWAEKAAASIFAPAGQSTITQSGYALRYYSGTQAYLGVRLADGRVLYSGPMSGGYGLEIGDFATFLALAKQAGY